MPEQGTAVDDRQLLKLLETGLGEVEAAKQLDMPPNAVQDRVKAYLDLGILLSNGEREKVDWRAYGQWVRAQRASEAA
jgi:hypothetical protein